MTIKEYYTNYKVNKEYPIELSSGKDKTIDDFYNNCIQQNILPAANVLAWHKMLMEYADRPDAIYWIRYFESGSKASGKWNNRRACVTRFADGFTYAFVSNFDAHEILNMVRLGVDPDVEEFADLMKSFQYPMHYCPGTSCEESYINAYPNIGTFKVGILTFKRWYLAHISNIKAELLRADGSYKAIDIKSSEGLKIYPRGTFDNWSPDKASSHKIRNLDYSLSAEEKNLVKAHFLRFVDPLNYYVTPGPKVETNKVCSRIGEYDILNKFMSSKFEILYGSKVMYEFRKKALIQKSSCVITGNEIIDVSYKNPTSLTAVKTPAPKTTTKSSTITVTTSGTGIGQYAKNVFQSLLENRKLDSTMIANLMDKSYCSRELGISYPVLAINTSDLYDPQRYYKNVVFGKYVICSQWYAKSRIRIDDWLSSNGF
jgi:hypothetical protein